MMNAGAISTAAAMPLDVDDICIAKYGHGGRVLSSEMGQSASRRRNAPAATENGSQFIKFEVTDQKSFGIDNLDSFLRKEEATRWTSFIDRRKRQNLRKATGISTDMENLDGSTDYVSQEHCELSKYTAKIATALSCGQEVWL
eukprot:CAMPEP_0113662666 /NCGR_PEP_ID=MMETSP0038_2-20120614/704_1 /TAXON_ID=2898 /ORGANISM="Cryptomonas paramecium" /LENGTH=142 /DNA_ID=CAMNT_0000577589 /DNA_START=21 /DNA_END=449 /DNA_ORIENTATION=- /assembly_acc=CAM_ASM_000170